MRIRCIQCGEADLEQKRIELPGTVRGQNYTVEMEGLACPRCGYKTIEGSAMPEYGRLLADKYRTDHGLLTSDEIRVRRKRLGMNQREFARHVGVGVASVKRWEMGKIQEQRNDESIKRKTDAEPRGVATWVISGSTAHESIITSTSAHRCGGVPDEFIRTQSTATGTWPVLPSLNGTIPAHLEALLIRPER